MTLVIPEAVGHCPRCNGAVTFMSTASLSKHDMQAWTDGWEGREDGWVRCPHCEATMTSTEMKKGRAPKSAIGDPQYAGAPALATPTAEQLKAAVLAHLEHVDKDSEEEGRARLTLWRAMNHARREAPDAPASAEDERNLKRLGALLGAFHPRASALPTKGILRVEVLRELGRFAAAKAALRRARAELDHLEALVDAGDRTVRHRPAAAEPWDGYAEEVAADMRAALAGDGEAARRVSVRFESGDGVPTDREAAAEWMQRATRAGSPVALSKAGIAELRSGDLHFGAALARLLPAARAGDADALRALGIGAELPIECARGVAFLGERGTPESVKLLLDYLDAARTLGKPRDPMPELIRPALVNLVERLGPELAEPDLKACLKELATAPT